MNNHLYTNNGEINIIGLINLLSSRYKDIFLSGIFFGILLTFFSYLQTPLFTSQISLFKINDSSFSLMSGSPINSIFGSDNQLNDRLKIDMKDLILSESLAKSIVNMEWTAANNRNMIEYWEFNKKGFLSRLLPNKDNSKYLKSKLKKRQ